MKKDIPAKYAIIMKRFSLIVFGILIMLSESEAAWFDYLPQKIRQPDGEVIDCFVSGDEFFNWIHDNEGYTIIQAADGYYYYAEKAGDILVPSSFKVKKTDPGKSGLRKWEKISENEYRRRYEEMFSYKLAAKGEPENAPLTGTLNNLVIYIRFQDDTEFTTARQIFDDRLNPATGVSVKSYYQEVSYGKLDLISTHYPASPLNTNLSYQDSHARSYFQPYNATTNPGGYTDSSQKMAREHTLLSDAVSWINLNSPVPVSLPIDNDFNNYVDNVCFIIKGDQGAWNDLLWAHRWALYSKTVYINGKRVFDYTLQPESQVTVRTLCHELFHSLGAPDLYHYTSDGISPAGPWCLMHGGGGHMLAYMKWKYTKNLWISSIPLISSSGTYTLNPLTSPENNCYRIASPNSQDEFFVVEYRNKSGTFETNLPGSGLIVYRIDTRHTGNADGPPDEVYIYRPDGTLTVNGNINNAFYSPSAGRTSITDLTNPNSFLQDGSIGGLNISNVSSPGPTISFNVTLVNPCTPPAAPIPGTITQPTCAVTTGSVVINGLPASGTWTLTRNPGNIITSGTGASTTISGLERGTYTFSVANASRCASAVSAGVVINAPPAPPPAPLVGTITQPSCSTPAGSVILSGLPSTGTWVLTRNPGAITLAGTGTSKIFPGLPAGTFTFTVTNSSGCTSVPSGNVVIVLPAQVPSAPVPGTVTQPSCNTPTGSVILNGLPEAVTWILTVSPGGATFTGTGTSRTVTGLSAGTYTFTVKIPDGCSSAASGNVIINVRPSIPEAPLIGSITHPDCSLATGSVVLNGLPATGTWTLTPSPGGSTVTGTGTNRTITGLPAGTYTYTITNSSGCISASSSGVVINPQPATPSAPVTGTITQPDCNIATGSVILNGLPSTGTWTLTRAPGGVTTTGTGSSITVTGLNPGTYSFTVTNTSGCISPASGNVAIIAASSSPTAPVVGTITHPTCNVSTGSVVLNSLPATGTWTITRTPGGTAVTGTGTSSTITGLPAGTYSFTVRNADGCSSVASGNVVINVQPAIPAAPVVGSITHPTCSLATGGVVLNDLPSAETWTLTRSPGGATITGTGTSRTITGLPAGTYTYTVTNSSGCISASSANVVINPQPAIPSAPAPGTITQPDCSNASGSVILNGLPSAGTWTLTRSPGGITTTGTGTSRTITGLSAGTYTYVVTNASGCISGASAGIIINPQPVVPSAPVVGAITNPTQMLPTGSVVLSGLPANGTWIITRIPGGVKITGTGTSVTVSGLQSGSYTFTVTNSSGCTSAPSASVVIIDPIIFNLNKPDGQPLHDNDTIKTGTTDAGNLILNVESNYSWGANENSLWLSAVKDGNSSVRIDWKENISLVRKNAVVTLTNQYNMAIRINIQQKARTSVFYGQKFENISVFPNPASDYIRLDLGEEKFEKLYVRITNIYGNIVRSGEFRDIGPGYIPEILIDDLPTGQYFLNIGDEKYIRTIRIIKF